MERLIMNENKTLILDKENPLMTKVIQRNGRSARILALNEKLKDGRSMVVLREMPGGVYVSAHYLSSGRFYNDEETEADIINAPRSIIVTAVWYGHGMVTGYRMPWNKIHPTDKDGVIAYREITLNEGEGLEVKS